jgi:hypothetical protein
MEQQRDSMLKPALTGLGAGLLLALAVGAGFFYKEITGTSPEQKYRQLVVRQFHEDMDFYNNTRREE